MRSNEYFTSWSPSRLVAWELCPAKAKYETILKTCPSCFKGTLKGKWGQPQICDKCGKEAVPGPALVRGDDIGNRLDAYLTGASRIVPIEIKNDIALAYVKKVKAAMKKGTGFVQKWIKLDSNWKGMEDNAFGAWFNGRLDAGIRTYGGKVFEIIDWKTGGVDKKTGQVKKDSGGKYDLQLGTYKVTCMAAMPVIQEAKATLVFTDTAPGQDPVVEAGTLKRADLVAERKKLEKRLQPFFADRTFAPRCNYTCDYCPFSRKKSGPCPY